MGVYAWPISTSDSGIATTVKSKRNWAPSGNEEMSSGSPNYTPEDARDQIEDDDEMFWKSVGIVGTVQGQTIVLQQLMVLRDGNVLPLDAHRTIGSSV